MTVLNTPEQIAAFRLRSVIAGLTIEVKTGMKHSRVNLLQVARKVYGVKSRTKVAALAELQAIYDGMVS